MGICCRSYLQHPLFRGGKIESVAHGCLLLRRRGINLPSSRAPKNAKRAGNPSSLVKGQNCEEDGRGVSGLNMETLRHALAEMEMQVGTLQSNIAFLKRCVEEGRKRDLGLGQIEGQCIESGENGLLSKGKGLAVVRLQGIQRPTMQALLKTTKGLPCRPSRATGLGSDSPAM